MNNKLPSFADPRWIFLIYASCFSLYAIISPGFTRTTNQFFASFLTCVILDYFLTRYYKKLNLFPLSGLLSSFGIFLMCDSPFVWPYFLAASLAIFSKHFLTINGRHIFNPNNFGIVLVSLFLSKFATVTSGRWGGLIWVMFALAFLGTYLAYRVDRLFLITSYVLTFIIGAWVRSIVLNAKLLTILGPGTGAAFQLFIFYHITDPITTPSNKKHQILFGLLLGTLDAYLRLQQNKFAPFLSFFVMTGFYSYFKSEYKLDKIIPWVQYSTKTKSPRHE